MNIVFFGLGSIGERHARLLQQHFPEHQLYAVRSGKSGEGKNNSDAKNSLNIPEFHALDDLPVVPDIAFITNPTSEHIPTALMCAKKGMHLFIEKPLSHTTEHLDELQLVLHKNKKRAYVAYCLRFHPVIQWLKEHLAEHLPLHVSVYNSSYLPLWRPEKNHLEGYSAHASLGGGVILDCSHELDYLSYLLGKPRSFQVQAQKAGNVTVDAEDTADMLLQFSSTMVNTVVNTIVNLHLDLLSHQTRRELIVNCQDHAIVADLLKTTVTLYHPEKKEPEIITFPFHYDDMYIAQLHYFFKQLEAGKNEGDSPDVMMNGYEEAREIFDTIIALKNITLESTAVQNKSGTMKKMVGEKVDL